MAKGERRGLVGLAKRTEGESGEDWLTTYGDLVTLLLTFFIMLVAMAKFDVQKFQQMAQSMSVAMGGKKDATLIPLKEIEQQVRSIIRREGLEREVSVQTRSDGVAIEARGRVSFLTGSAELNPEFQRFLVSILPEIKGTFYNISVEGHTDNVPIGGIFPSNWELSAARASSVVRFFVDHGVPSERFRATGFADTLPKKPNSAPDGRPIPDNQALNRRVVIVFLAIGRPEAERR